MEGRRIYSTRFSGNRLEVPVNDLSKGIYMVQLYAEGKRVTGKFIVIK